MSGYIEGIRAEAIEIAEEREMKAAESFMIADVLRQQDKDPSAFLAAGQHALRTAVVLRALAEVRS